MEMLGLLPDDPAILLRTVIVGIGGYVGLVILLRISGKRTLSSMNAFDFIVTVAFGSTLASILISPTASLLQGLVAFALLVVLQFVITWTSQRSERVARLVKSEPAALLKDGRMQHSVMRRERVLAVEIEAALREHGISSVEQVDLVVLETDGSFSVIRAVGADGEALARVSHAAAER